MNIFAELIHAVYDFKNYPGFRRNKGGKAFLYALVLNLIYFVLALILPMVVTILSFGGFGNVAKAMLPDFRLEDGRLWVAETYDVQEYNTAYGGIYVRVDTGRPLTEEITDVDLLAFDRVLVMDAEHMIVKADGGSAIRVSYEELDLGNWDREMVVQRFLPLVPAFLWMFFMFLVCFVLADFFVSALVLSGIGCLMSAITGCGLRFGEIYKLAIYASTPALVVECVYSWTPAVFSYFYLISYGISAFYMWKALQRIKEEELNAPGTGLGGWA